MSFTLTCWDSQNLFPFGAPLLAAASPTLHGPQSNTMLHQIIIQSAYPDSSEFADGFVLPNVGIFYMTL